MSEPTGNPVDAIAAWHDLLAAGNMAERSAAWLTEGLAHRGLFFGDRPLCTVLRPRMLTRHQYDLLRRGVKGILSALETVGRAALADPALLAQFRLEPWETELISSDPGTGPANPLARVDAFFTPDGRGFRITEINGETPAGPAYADALAAIFHTMPVMRRFRADRIAWPLPARHGVLHTLLGAWEAAGGSGRPVIAIVDWAGVPTWSEFLLFQQYFGEQGIPSLLVTPEQLEYRDGRLRVEGTPVDIVYKRILLHELVAREGLDHPLIRAVRAGAVTMVNGFRCKLLHKKASLAALTDERNARLFDAGQRAAIAAHVPWTRVMEPRRTRWQDREVDLVDTVVRHRERFVIKPNDDYGGHGIVLGWETGAADWEAAVGRALEAPYIVQERIDLPRAPFPRWEDGRLELIEPIVDTAPYAFNGTMVDGCLTRLASASLVNVTAGTGSTVATFVVEDRHT